MERRKRTIARKYKIDCYLWGSSQLPKIKKAEYSYRLVVEGREDAPRCGTGYLMDTTANQLMLQSLIAALQELKYSCSITVHTDSFYLKNAGEKLKEWKGNGWKTNQGKPVKNADILELLEEKLRPHTVNFIQEQQIELDLQENQKLST